METANSFIVLPLFAVVTIFALIGIVKSTSKEGKRVAVIAFCMALIGLSTSACWYISDSSKDDGLKLAFNSAKTIYCTPNIFEGKKIKVNKSDGWYLDGDMVKNRELGYSMSIERCKEVF